MAPPYTLGGYTIPSARVTQAALCFFVRVHACLARRDNAILSTARARGPCKKAIYKIGALAPRGVRRGFATPVLAPEGPQACIRLSILCLAEMFCAALRQQHSPRACWVARARSPTP